MATLNIDDPEFAVSFAKWEEAKRLHDAAKLALAEAADELRVKLIENADNGADLVHADGRAAAKWTRKSETVKDVAGLAAADVAAFMACAKPADFDAVQLKRLYPALYEQYVTVRPSNTYELRGASE